MFPKGEWTGWYFSEEVKYAISLGYKIKLRGIGYQFDKGKPLKEYVDVFYDLKKNADNPVDKLISKLFLNSLYGKFGMNRVNSSIKVLTNSQFLALVGNKNYEVSSIIEPKGDCKRVS